MGDPEAVGNLKGRCIISLTPSSRAEAAVGKAPGLHGKEFHSPILGHVPEGQGSTGAFPRS